MIELPGNTGKWGASVKCPGNMRHWYTGGVGVKLPFCARCGAERPEELSDDEWVEAEDWCRNWTRGRMILERTRSKREK